MGVINLQNILTLIPAAAIIASVVFLVKFFGKITSDQVPFADSRSWHEELTGITFFINWVISPSVFAYILYSEGWSFKFKIWDVLLFVAWLVFVNNVNFLRKLNIKFFKEDCSFEDDMVKIISVLKDDSQVGKSLFLYLRYAILLLTPIALTILLFYYINWRVSPHYYFSLGVYILFSFIYVAILLSLSKKNINFVNIIFNNGNEILDCRLLKVNKDNIRVRINDRACIINKNEVLSINYLSDVDKKDIWKKEK